MITEVSYLLPAHQRWLIEKLESHREALTPDVSNYAKGRLRYWLQYQALLRRDGGYTNDAVRDEELWAFLQQIYPEAQLGLAIYGEVGIGPHRDHTYADPHGVAINLGEVEGWSYQNRRTSLALYPELPDAPTTIFHPRVGAVWHFNTKNLHAVINPAPDRWAVFLWKISQRERAHFEYVTK
jgi:hypothetical protein